MIFFSSWKVNCFRCWELIVYGRKKPKLVFESNNSLGFLSTFKTKQLSVLRIVQLWWKKTWTTTWVQNWTRLLNFCCCLQYLTRNFFGRVISKFMNKLMLFKVEFVICWKQTCFFFLFFLQVSPRAQLAIIDAGWKVWFDSSWCVILDFYSFFLTNFFLQSKVCRFYEVYKFWKPCILIGQSKLFRWTRSTLHIFWENIKCFSNTRPESTSHFARWFRCL
jgi:hypothetical protein